MANAFAHERTALSSEHTRVPMLSLTLTLIQGAAVVVGLACWLMLLPMLYQGSGSKMQGWGARVGGSIGGKLCDMCETGR